MKHFFTILKDSYREAMDGWIIYVMLGLSTLVILLVGTISYKPVDNIEQIKPIINRSVRAFAIFIPDKGNSRAFAGSSTVMFVPEDISYTKNQLSLKLGIVGTSEEFKKMVAGWASPDTRKQAPKLPKIGRNEDDEFDVEAASTLLKDLAIEPSKDAINQVTEEMEIEFIKSQFHSHMKMNQVKVSVIPGSIKRFAIDVDNVVTSPVWPHQISMFFGAAKVWTGPKGAAMYFIEDWLVNGIGAAVTLVISLIVTGFFIPNMIRKGSYDLIIAKPIGRIPLLIYKYLGGCILIFITTMYTICGIWFVTGLQSGTWDPRLLITIPMTTFTFALLYAMSTLVGVLTRSSIASILLTIAFAFGLYVIGKAKFFSEIFKNDWNPTFVTVVDTLNTIAPRYKDIDNVTTKWCAPRYQPDLQTIGRSMFIEEPSIVGTLGLTSLYIVLMLSLASWRVSTRDG